MGKAKYYNGKTITEWANEYGIKRSTLSNRIKDGWNIEDAITVPHGKRRPKEISLHKIAVDNKTTTTTLKKRISAGMTIEEALCFQYKKNFIGNRYNRLLVIEEIEQKRDPNGRARRQFICLCDCGEQTTATADALSAGNKQSCGCLRKEMLSKMREHDLTGMTFNRWYVESEAYRNKNGIFWNCVCSCGVRGIVNGGNLVSGVSGSCGCYNREQISKRERIDLTGQTINDIYIIEFIGTNENNNCIWRCRCHCGEEFETLTTRLLSGQTISCGCTKSKGEYEIEKFLKTNNIKHKRNVYFTDLKLSNYLYFDFGIWDKDNNIYLIEFQGSQHYDETAGRFGKQQREITDPMKKKYCKNNNIPLFEIRFDENITERIKEIVAQVNPVLNE